MPFTTLDLSKQSGTSLPSSIVTASGLSTGKVLQVIEGDVTTATSSKVLILANLNGVGKHSGADRGGFRITRAGTELKVFSQSVADNNDSTANFFGSADTIVYLDSPNSTSSLEYEVTGKRFNSSGALRVNCNNGYSSLTLIEILA